MATAGSSGSSGTNSLSSVVSNLVRAQMGTSLAPTVTDEDLDRHVAELILKEAKKKAERYNQHGVHAYVTNNMRYVFNSSFVKRHVEYIATAGGGASVASFAWTFVVSAGEAFVRSVMALFSEGERFRTVNGPGFCFGAFTSGATSFVKLTFSPFPLSILRFFHSRLTPPFHFRASILFERSDRHIP